MYGWTFNALLLGAAFCMSPKRRWPFLISLAGNIGWASRAVYLGMVDMAFLSIAFGCLSIKNYRKWGRVSCSAELPMSANRS